MKILPIIILFLSFSVFAEPYKYGNSNYGNSGQNYNAQQIRNERINRQNVKSMNRSNRGPYERYRDREEYRTETETYNDLLLR